MNIILIKNDFDNQQLILIDYYEYMHHSYFVILNRQSNLIETQQTRLHFLNNIEEFEKFELMIKILQLL